MKILLRISFSVIILLVVVGIAALVAYVSGSKLPVDHSVSVTGTIAATPAKVFARITDIAAAPTVASRGKVGHRPAAGQRPRPLDRRPRLTARP